MAAYLDAKLRLFRELLLPEGTAVVNVDDPAGAEVVAACRARGVKLIAYGRAQADLRLIDQRPTPTGQVLRLEIFGTACEVARSEEHTSELQSLMRNSSAGLC